jgi:hypothetical protein
MVVTYKVSYSHSNDSDEFSWAWNVPDSLNNIFPLCLKILLLYLKMLLNFKKRQVFLAHPVYSFFSRVSECSDYKLFLWVLVQNVLFVLSCKKNKLQNGGLNEVRKQLVSTIT